MMRKTRLAKLSRIVFAILVGFLILTTVPPAHKSNAANEVDLVLLLSLDVSASVDAREFELMTGGLAKALMSREVGSAIRNGRIGAIAISVLQWSGYQEQNIKIDWIRVSSPLELRNLADRIAGMPRRYLGGATDIGGAINFSRKHINSAPFQTNRRTIDVAGDGANNVNENPSRERDITVKSGIIINGLAVIGETQALVPFYNFFVKGGPAAFVEEARDYDSFGTAMRRKLIREIGAQLLF